MQRLLLLPIILGGLLNLGAASPPPSFSGTAELQTLPSVAPLIESDWLRRDGPPTAGSIRQILARGHKLVERLSQGGLENQLQWLKKDLDTLESHLAAGEKTSSLNPGNLEALFLESCRTVRAIAFANPLLQDIDRLLFITRHDAKGVFHMVDQFYGFNAQPGGQLLVLQYPFGDKPRIADLLINSVVERGRLKGRKLENGAFLSPEVSFDGKTILSAWTEATGKDLEWSPQASYHLFKCNADGSGLAQLTDGAWNDFDPCFLPGGRIAFVSERRGGYLRCGRHCPVYTLYGMEPDGSDIICLSYHETHEWHPSITHEGMIVYTRWDYVDRDTNIAHHPWECRPDGGNPRAIHGNYPARRESRPWMEMDIRAIPGSRKYVAVAAAHHGNAFGSLVVFDPRVEDDGAMSPLTRLTPEAPFPEAEAKGKAIKNSMVFGTPWPLSEDDYLCVYGIDGTNRGLYWIDRLGNQELIYHDPAISCLSPIPLIARPTPPVIPDATLETAASRARSAHLNRPATIALMNVYDSDFDWPEGTEIKALRIIQALPKSTPPPNEPRIGVADQTNARAVLGAVPVESDGSAYFEAPPGKTIYFQALDAQGLAVQSMRSATFVHRGEQLSCQGCHEPRHRIAKSAGLPPLALRRAPSRIQPDVEGSNPFSFVRLVQPVLDRKCAGCHREKKALDLSNVVEGKYGWTRSYQNLANKYGFYFHVSNGSINQGIHGGSRTLAGQFGAKVSKLLPYLDETHYDTRLTPEERHRITLWLDCNSEFYGAYERIEQQARGETVWPSLQ